VHQFEIITLGLKILMGFIGTLTLGIGGVGLMNIMLVSVTQRTREIGVLKSLGASKGYIVEIILSETTLLCIAGVLVGVGLSLLSRSIFLRLFPSLTILITLKWILLAGMIAVLGGLLGATYPAWLASRKDPVEALAYE